MTDLDNLIEAIEAGDTKPANFRCLDVPMHDMRYTHMPNYAKMAYRGSLDAVKALHDALVPNMEWAMYGPTGNYRFFEVQLENERMRSNKSVEFEPFTGSAETPARAWLIAILKAHRA